MNSLEQKVKYKNDLKILITKLSIDQIINEKINLLNHIKNEYNFVEHDQLVQNYTELIQKNEDTINTIKKIIDRIDNEISKVVDTQLNNVDNTPPALLPISDDVESLLLAKINSYSQFKYPGLQLNCIYFQHRANDSLNITKHLDPLKWLSSMVASDPFYLAGPMDAIGGVRHLDNIILPYPEIYQKRLRLYGLYDRNLEVLPQSQFGLILCWDFFNYQTLGTIDLYLSKIIKLLRPGGVLIFSYNNCEFAESARLVDNHLSSWATPSALEKMFLAQGYELIEFKDVRTDVISYCSWVEVRRPGKLTTVKLSQAHGLVQRK
jgi:SAM-dependent methyltransferase